jgi:hypothetical protein
VYARIRYAVYLHHVHARCTCTADMHARCTCAHTHRRVRARTCTCGTHKCAAAAADLRGAHGGAHVVLVVGAARPRGPPRRPQHRLQRHAPEGARQHLPSSVTAFLRPARRDCSEETAVKGLQRRDCGGETALHCASPLHPESTSPSLPPGAPSRAGMAGRGMRCVRLVVRAGLRWAASRRPHAAIRGATAGPRPHAPV